MANNRYDLVVIGSGPGGYVAAIRAAQLKMRVAVIERDRPGGVCLNWGCIPSKALLNSATAMDTIRGASKEHGIETGEIRFDFTKVIARSRAAADKLSKGVLYLFKKNKIDYFEADATITGPHSVALAPLEGKPAPASATLDGERILIAAGSGERLFPGMKVGDGVVTSKEALVLEKMPASVVVIGAGAIGLEFGYFYSAFGAKVTIVELEKQMLPGIDAEVVLVAVGRAPLSRNIGLEKLGIELERGGFIKTNDSFQTTVPSIYSIGDVIRPPLLAHKASAEGIAAVEIMAGVREPGFDLLAIPACIYCEPEVATVGLSEAEAKARGIEVKVGKFPFRAIGKAVAIGEVAGFVKIVATKQYGEVIGCQIVGHAATDIISEVVLGKTLETTVTEIGKTAHPHPTMSEAIMQAALAADGEAIDF